MGAIEFRFVKGSVSGEGRLEEFGTFGEICPGEVCVPGEFHFREVCSLKERPIKEISLPAEGCLAEISAFGEFYSVEIGILDESRL